MSVSCITGILSLSPLFTDLLSAHVLVSAGPVLTLLLSPWLLSVLSFHHLYIHYLHNTNLLYLYITLPSLVISTH